MFSWAVRGETTRQGECTQIPEPRPASDSADVLRQQWVDSEAEAHVLLDRRDQDFVITHANTAARELLRLTPDDFGSTTIGAVIPSPVATRVPAACQRVWASGIPHNAAEVLWAAIPQAGPAWVDLRVRRFLDRVGLLVIDTTHRHRQQEELAAGEARYRALAEKASDLVFRIRGRNRVAWVSPSLSDVLGYCAADVVGHELRAFIHPDDVESAECHGEDPHRFDARFRHADGHWEWLSIVTRLDYNDENRPIGRIGSALKIGTLKAQDDGLKTALAELRDEKRRLRAVLDADLNPRVVLQPVMDGSGRIVDLEYQDCNPAAEQYLGMARCDLLGHKLSELHSSATVDAGLHWARRVLATGAAVEVRDRPMVCEVTHQNRRFDMSLVRMADAVCLSWRAIT